MRLQKEEKEQRWLATWEHTRKNKWKYICTEALLKGLVVGSIMFIVSSLSDPAQYFNLKWLSLYILPTPFFCIFYGLLLFRSNERLYLEMTEE